jgi:hypothetical protein
MTLRMGLETNRWKNRFGPENGHFGGCRNRVYDVADYRLYGLDRVNNVASGEWIEADDDETAIEVAKEMMDGHDCELWKGKRLVARIPRRPAG